MNQKSWFFNCYGQTIKSQFDLSSLGINLIPIIKKTNEFDILISKNLSKPGVTSDYQDNQTSVDKDYGYYFRKEVGLFEFIKAKEIKVSPFTKEISKDFIRILMNYPMACNLYQKGFFLLHASAVRYMGKVFIFPGSTLSGKSTIAAYLIKLGGKLITEDTAVININKKRATILPSYPMIKISDKAKKYTRLSDKEGIFFKLEKNNRKGYRLNESNFEKKEVDIDFCIFPVWANKEMNKILKPSPKDLISLLLESSLSIYPLNKEKEEYLFKQNFSFINKVRTFIYKRDKRFSNLEGLRENLINMVDQ